MIRGFIAVPDTLVWEGRKKMTPSLCASGTKFLFFLGVIPELAVWADGGDPHYSSGYRPVGHAEPLLWGRRSNLRFLPLDLTRLELARGGRLLVGFRTI